MDISSSENETAFSIDSQSEITVTNTDDWKFLNNYKGNYKDYDLITKSQTLTTVKYSNDGKYLFFSPGAVFKVIDLTEYKEVYVYKEMNLYNRSSITKIAVSDDNRILLTSHYDGSIIRWKIFGITEVEDIKMETDNLEIYPNPASEALYIKSQDDINSITITDMLGKSIKINTNSIKNNLYTFDVSCLRSGVYLLSYLNGKDIHSVKFIKE
jgi:WD40 repeat protein